MKSEAGKDIDSPAGTDMPAEAGTTPAKRAGERSMRYFAQSGTQKPHPAKPAQGNVLHYLSDD